MFQRFSLKVVFPPPYEREVWHFKKANIDHRKAINDFEWEKSFQNTNVNYMAHLFYIELSKIYYVISSHMKQSHVRTEIHLRLIVR